MRFAEITISCKWCRISKIANMQMPVYLRVEHLSVSATPALSIVFLKTSIWHSGIPKGYGTTEAALESNKRNWQILSSEAQYFWVIWSNGSICFWKMETVFQWWNSWKIRNASWRFALHLWSPKFWKSCSGSWILQSVVCINRWISKVFRHSLLSGCECRFFGDSKALVSVSPLPEKGLLLGLVLNKKK